jgi:hypothetical protein
MPRISESWYLAVEGGPRDGFATVGTIHKSLTVKLLLSRYIACQLLTALKVMGVDVSGITVSVRRNGEVQSKDEF